MQAIRLILSAFVPLVALAATPASVLPIKEIAGLTPNESAFKASGATKPLTLKSEKEAADYFAAGELAKLVQQVDFKNQIVLVFAWQGSGQDRLDYTVAESYPEQIRFTYTRGRTRDLRSHTRVYALRANVVWSAN